MIQVMIINLLIKILVTNIIRIPKSNIVAKPFTELSPKKNNTPAITVVKFESNIVKKELLFALE